MFKLTFLLLAAVECCTAFALKNTTSNPTFRAQTQSIFNGARIIPSDVEMPRRIFRRTSLLTHKNRKDIKRNGKSDRKQLHRIIISVKQSNLDILESFVDDISDPDSINFGCVKTRAEISALTDHTVSSNYIINYLNGAWREKSFTVDKSVFGEYLSVTAPIELFEDLLETTFDEYSQTLPNSDAPVVIHRAEEYSLPAAIVDHIHSVFLAIDLPPVTSHRQSKNGIRQEATEYNQAKNPSDKGINAATNTFYGSVTPALLNKFYSITNNTGSAAVSQGVYEAIGQTFSPSDLKIFQSLFGLPQQAIHSIYGGHVSDNACQNSLNDCAEANLDVQYLMAVCQSTPTNYYYWNSTTDYWEGFLLDLANRVTSATPLVVSISYGSREHYFSTSYLRSFNIEALKLAAQGVTLIASSGDDGANYLYFGRYADCYYTPDFPASSPFVTAVGATQGPELNEMEVACSSNTSGVITSGGGFSDSFRTPLWQQTAVDSYLNSSVGNSSANGYNGKGRGYPDVSLMGRKYAVVLGGVVHYLYGTSASAPVFAGMVSLVNAARVAVGKGGVGWINPSLYKYSKQFSNDIIGGNNKCLSNGACCPTGFTATHGWDPVTGLGSVNFTKFKDLFVSFGNKLNIPTLSPSQIPGTVSQKSPKPSITASPSKTAMPTITNSGWLYKHTYEEKSCGGDVVNTYSMPLGTCLPKYATAKGNYSIEGYQVFSCNNGVPSVSYFFREGCSFANNNFKMSESFSTDCIDTADDTNYYVVNTQYSNVLRCSSSTSYLSTFPPAAFVGESFAVNTIFHDRHCTNISAVQVFAQYRCINGYFSDGVSAEGESYGVGFAYVLIFDESDCEGPSKQKNLQFNTCNTSSGSSIELSHSWSIYTASANPTITPTGPSLVPSPAPTVTSSPTYSSSVSCAYFSTTYTSYCPSAGTACPSCSFIACPSTTIYVKLTNTNSYYYYQYFYLLGPNMEYLYSSSITEGYEVSYTFYYDGECTSFTLLATCNYGSCSGAYIIGGAIAEPSPVPSINPTGPSVVPTSFVPSVSPSTLASVKCPFYQAFNTSMATKRYIVCSFYACQGAYIVAQPQYDIGTVYARLYDGSGYMVSSGIYVYYTVLGTCQTFTLRQGCYDYYYGPSACSGSYVVTNAVSVPSSTPSVTPTGPSLVPSATPRSTTLPTGPTQVPSYITAVDCGDLASSYLNPASCYFIACGGKYLSITPTSYYGSYGYLRLYDSSGEQIQTGYYSMVLSTPVDSVCQTYTLKLECYYYYYCTSANPFLFVPLGSPAPTSTPTALPSGPTFTPSAYPSKVPTVAPSPFVSAYYCRLDTTYSSTFDSSSCYFYACPGKELRFNAVKSLGSPYFTLRNAIGSYLTSVYPPYSYITVSNAYAKCQTYKLTMSCGYYFGTCSATIRIDGGAAPPTRLPTVSPSVPSFRPSSATSKSSGPSYLTTSQPTVNISETYYYSNISIASPSLPTTIAPSPGVPRKWILGAYGQSCDSACASFQYGSICSAANTGLFTWPLTEEQLKAVRSSGVYDVVNRGVLSGDGLCSTVSQDSLGTFPDDPSVSGSTCYYGGQSYADRGECSAAAVGGDRRFCPCSISDRQSVAPTRKPTVSLTIKPSTKPTAKPLTSSPAGVFGSRTWVLGAYQESCDSTCVSFQSNSICSADSTGLFAWPLTAQQLSAVRSNGAYDVVNRAFLSGDALCLSIITDSLGSFPDDPTVSGRYCYYGGQRYADRGECSVVAVGGDRRFCPCLVITAPSATPTRKSTDNISETYYYSNIKSASPSPSSATTRLPTEMVPITPKPSKSPTSAPSSFAPTGIPTLTPSAAQTLTPSKSSTPQALPSVSPQALPSADPTFMPSMGSPSAQPSSVSSGLPTNEMSNLPTTAPALEPQINMQQSMTLMNIALSSLTAEFIGILQSSIRAAVANVTSIPIVYISTPILSALSNQRSLLAALLSLQDVATAMSRSSSSNLIGTTSADVGIVATYSIVAPTSVINAALNTSSGSGLASVCSARLNANNGSVLMTSVKAQVQKSSSSAATLLTLLANTTIAKISVVLVPPASPSLSPVLVNKPTYTPTTADTVTTSGGGTSSDSSNIGLYIGVAVAAAVVAIFIVLGYFYYLLKKNRNIASAPKEPTNSSQVIIEYNPRDDVII